MFITDHLPFYQLFKAPDQHRTVFLTHTIFVRSCVEIYMFIECQLPSKSSSRLGTNIVQPITNVLPIPCWTVHGLKRRVHDADRTNIVQYDIGSNMVLRTNVVRNKP